MHILIHSLVHPISTVLEVFPQCVPKFFVYDSNPDALYRASALRDEPEKSAKPCGSSVSLLRRTSEDTAGAVGQEWWDER